MKKIELMSPAGSLPALKAAVSNGADAVYLGSTRFNARASAVNFSKGFLRKAIRICQANSVKTRLTMNVLVRNDELKDYFKDIEDAYSKGIDAVIVQDHALIPIIRKNFPDLAVHLSTQASVMNSYHADIAGADRINLARELRKEEIAKIRKNYAGELEVFVHGALCVSVSGMCLMSSFLGGRSGNRGRCAQPCRKRYGSCHELSLADLNLVDRIPELVRIGIDSLKIEGRMRTPFYTAATTSVYRKAIDSYYSGDFKVTADMKKTLDMAFNRGFTEGSYTGNAEFSKMAASGRESAIIRDYRVNAGKEPAGRKHVRLMFPYIKAKVSRKQLLVRAYTLRDAVDAEKSGADIVYYDIFDDDFPVVKDKLDIPVFCTTPRIMLDSDIPHIKSAIKKYRPDGLLASNLGASKLGTEMGLECHIDYPLNPFNDIDVSSKFSIVSPELGFRDLSGFKNKDFGVLVHGKLRLMTLRHEICHSHISDKKGRFRISKIKNGVELLNEKELGLFSKSSALVRHGIKSFFIDTDDDVKKITSFYRDILDNKKPDDSKLKKRYVLGWFFRGVR